MSPRKVRLVVDMVRGMDAGPAIDQLKYMNKAAARPVRKLLESAVANAKHNNRIEKDNLFVKAITVDQGPTLKRWRPRAMGASAALRKRTSHVSVTLGAKDESKVPKSEKKEAKKPTVKKEGAKAEDGKEKKDAKAAPKKEEAKKVERSAKPVPSKVEGPAMGKAEGKKKPAVRKAAGRKK